MYLNLALIIIPGQGLASNDWSCEQDLISVASCMCSHVVIELQYLVLNWRKICEHYFNFTFSKFSLFDT